MDIAGAILFGAVVGWVTYRTLRRSEDKVGLSDIATVLGVVGGAAVTTLFDEDDLFGAYSIGLAFGFFLYFAIALKLEGRQAVVQWMGNTISTKPALNQRPTD